MKIHFRNRTIFTKIFLGAMLILILAALMGGVLFYSLGSVAGVLRQITERNAPSIRYPTMVGRYALRTLLDEKKYLLLEKEELYEQAMRDLQEIYANLDKVDEVAGIYNDEDLLQQSKHVRRAVEEYQGYYRRGAALLKENQSLAHKMSMLGTKVTDLSHTHTVEHKRLWEEAIAKGMDPTKPMEGFYLCSEIEKNALQARMQEKDYLLYEKQEHFEGLKEHLATLKEQYDEYSKIAFVFGHQSLIKEIRQATEEYLTSAEKWMANDNEWRKIRTEMQETGTNLQESAWAVQEVGWQRMDRSKRIAMLTREKASRASILVGVVTLIAGMVGAFFIARGIASPIKELTRATRSIAEGDLSRRVAVTARDEVGRLAVSFNAMGESLQHTMVSRDYFDHIIKAMMDTLIVVDTEASILTVNPATCDLLGYREEELIGQPVSLLFAEEEEEEEASRFFQFFREPEKAGLLRSQDTIYNRAFTYKTKDGRLIPMLFNASVLTDAAGTVTGVVAGAKDITELKVAEAEIRKERNFSANIIATVPDSLVVVDKDLGIKSANLSFCKVFGIELEKVIGRHITDILGDEDGRLSAELSRLFGTEDLLEDFEWRDPSEKLGKRIFHITARSIIFAEEEEEELVVIEDITARKRAEEALIKQQAELSQANAILEEQNRVLKAFYQIGQVILSSLDLGEVLDNLGRYIIEAGIFRSLMIALVDESTQSVEVVQSQVRSIDYSGPILPDPRKVVGLRYSLNDVNITAEVARTGAMQVIEGWDDRFGPVNDDPPAHKDKMSYFIPVKKGDRTVAVLATGSRIAEKEELLYRIQVMSPLLDEVAIALENAQLFEEVHAAEQELRQSEARLVEAQRIAHLGSWDWDTVKGELRWSDETYRIFGLSPQESGVPCEPFLDAVHPDDREAVEEAMNTALYEHTPYRMDYRIVREDGVERVVHAQAEVFFDERGRAIRMAGTVQDITERKRAEEELQRRLNELTALHAIAVAGSGATSQDEFIEHATRVMGETLHMEDVAVVLLDEATGTLYPHPSHRLREGSKAPILRLGEGIVGQVALTGQPRRVPDVRLDIDYRQADPQTRSELCVPLKVGESVIGVINTESMQRNAYTQDDERLLTTMANQIGLAIQNARLFDEAQRRLNHVQALRDIDMAITASLDVRVILNVILDQVTTQLGVDAADVLLLNPHTLTLEYAAGRGFRTAALQHTHLRVGEGYAGRAALECRIVSIPDLAEAKDGLKHSPLLASEAFLAYYAAPLIAKGQVKGVLEIFHRALLDSDQEWLDFLQAMAIQAAIAIDNAELFDKVQRSNVELTLAYDTTLEGWSRALELRDYETEGHTRRVTEMALRLARAMGMSSSELVHVLRGALLHDIGKMGVSDTILLKPGPLSDEEWEMMRRHPVYAYELISPIRFLQPALDIPYCHHEKWDGTGYPQGLRGESIPMAARIFAVADVWDALRSDRPYREAWAQEKAMEYVREQTGKHFDPKVVEVFLGVIGEASSDLTPCPFPTREGESIS